MVEEAINGAPLSIRPAISCLRVLRRQVSIHFNTGDGRQEIDQSISKQSSGQKWLKQKV